MMPSASCRRLQAGNLCSPEKTGLRSAAQHKLVHVSAELNPKRTVAELKELRSLTGDENGAQRVAFTPTWAKARKWLRSKIEEVGAEVHNDAAGNLWGTL